MAPHKLENQINEKLNNRTIQPSSQAWDRLDAMLAVAETKKSKRAFVSVTGMRVAAGILLLVTLGVGYFFYNKELPNTPDGIVVTPTSSHTSETEQGQIESIQVASIPVEEPTTPLVKPSNRHPKKHITSSIPEPITHSEVSIINPINSSNNQEAQVSIALVEVSQPLEQVPVKKRYIQADELLSQVEMEQKSSTSQNNTTIKVDSKNLLSEIDKEVNSSFRERVLYNLEKKYQKTKEAIVQRNSN